MSGDIEPQFNRLMLVSAIHCCVTLAVCGLTPASWRIPSFGEIALHERNHNICQHFIHIHIGVHVAVEDNKTRPVVWCNSSQYMYGSTRDVLLSVLTFPLPSESCPVDDLPSSAGPDVEWWTWMWWTWPWEVFYAPCLVDALFQARYCRYTATKRCCNVFCGLTRHEHPKGSVSFIFWEPWYDCTDTYSTSTKPFLYNSYLPMIWRKEKVENLHLSCSTWFTSTFTKLLFVSKLYLLCRNYQWICKHKRSTRVILNFDVFAMFNKRVIHIWNVCVFKCTEHT